MSRRVEADANRADDGDADEPTAPLVPRRLFALFFASGITGLLYESIWSRYIRLLLGSAATAQVVVLALFMGGLSIGALWVSRRSASIRRPFLAYAMVEAIVGAYALAFPWLFEGVKRVAYDVLLPSLGGGWAADGLKWSLATVLVLPPCILLGATFPLMSVGMVRTRPHRAGRLLALLYFWNSLGAALGALLTGFALVPWLGLPGTLVVGGLVNLGIGVVASRYRAEQSPLLTGTREASPEPQPSTGRNHDGTSNSSSPIPMLVVVALAAGTGLASFIYEVGWMRLLAMILGSATHSFEVMLSAFVLGLALGGWWIRKRIDRLRHPGLTLAGVQLVMGMLAIVTLPLYRVAAAGIASVFYQDERTTAMWLAFNVMRYAVCLAMMLPATFCAGMTLPLLTHWLLARGASEQAIGRVYALNTLGSIAGAVLAGMWLLPAVGIVRTVVTGAAIDMGLGLLLLGGFGAVAVPLRAVRRRAAIGSVAMLALGWWRVSIDPHVLVAGVFRRGITELSPRFETVSHVDGRTASITVMRDGDDPSYHAIYTNGKPDASIRTDPRGTGRSSTNPPRFALDEPTQILVGVLPLLTRPDAKRAALIGLGSGVTAHAMLGSSTLRQLDTVEIEPEMAAAARRLGPHNGRVFEDPRSHLYFDDAKAHFAGAGEKYDVIVSQPSNPWVSGVSSLFTVEFYAEVRRYLGEGGVLAQWVQGYELSDDLLNSMLAAVHHEFADYRVFRVGSRDWLVLASVDQTVPNLSPIPTDWPDVRDDLSLLGVHTTAQLDALLAANRRMLAPTLTSVAPNRDAYPIVDTGAERSRFMRHSAESLLALRLFPLPLREVFGEMSPHEYPRSGVSGVLTARHVLAEPEKAGALLRAYETRDASALGASEMAAYLEHRARFASAPRDADVARAWFYATYEVYNRVAPWIELRDHAWWQEVRDLAARPGVTTPVARSVSLIDAVIERDGPAALSRAEIELQAADGRLDPRFLALVGALGLELSAAPAHVRNGFVERHMMGIGNGKSSDDRAFRIVRQQLLAETRP